MIKSMTAFARKQLDTELGALSWELRSVNHRYAEFSIRLPDELRVIEPRVRECLAVGVKRGKVDATLRYKPNVSQDAGINLNTELVTSVLKACTEVEREMDNPARINPVEILRWSGVMQPPQLDMERLRTDILALLEQTIAELLESRLREGEKINGMLMQRNDAVQQQLSVVRDGLPGILQDSRSKLMARLEEYKAELDQNRLEQEMVFLAQKIDVEEELDRLDVHIEEMRRVLTLDEPVGRRLDFLMQEFNREVNTLGAKSISAVTTRASVDMKVLVEQMREQIQNVE